MSDMATPVRALAHHGVKGMKWGVRRDRSAREVSVSTNDTKKKTKAKIKTKGGENLPAHPDAIAAEVAKRVVKKSGHAALSNDELRQLATRMQLEKQVSELSGQTQGGASKFIKKQLAETGKQQVSKVVNQKANEKVDKIMAEQKKPKK